VLTFKASQILKQALNLRAGLGHAGSAPNGGSTLGSALGGGGDSTSSDD
jgi:hypothetical protein